MEETEPAEAPESSTQGLTTAEEMELARLRDKTVRAAHGATARLKVEPPHTAMHHGGYQIGRDWSTVPESAVPMLMEAAAGAKVTITREG